MKADKMTIEKHSGIITNRLDDSGRDGSCC